MVEVEPTDTLGSLFQTAASLCGGAADASSVQLLSGSPELLHY